MELMLAGKRGRDGVIHGWETGKRAYAAMTEMETRTGEILGESREQKW
jgi:hypothetical protein